MEYIIYRHTTREGVNHRVMRPHKYQDYPAIPIGNITAPSHSAATRLLRLHLQNGLTHLDRFTAGARFYEDA